MKHGYTVLIVHIFLVLLIFHQDKFAFAISGFDCCRCLKADATAFFAANGANLTEQLFSCAAGTVIDLLEEASSIKIMEYLDKLRICANANTKDFCCPYFSVKKGNLMV